MVSNLGRGVSFVMVTESDQLTRTTCLTTALFPRYNVKGRCAVRCRIVHMRCIRTQVQVAWPAFFISKTRKLTVINIKNSEVDETFNHAHR